MHLHEREAVAAIQRRASILIDIADEITAARNLVRAGQMAAGSLTLEASSAITEVLGLVVDRLTDIGATVADLIADKGETSYDA